MKKLLSLTLAVLFVAVIAGSAFAGNDGAIAYTRGVDARIKTDILASAQNGELSSDIGINDLVLGWKFTDSSAGSGDIYDETAAATVRTSATNVIDEMYVAAGGVSVTMFPTPFVVTRGLVARTLNSTGRVIVFYEER